MLSAGRTRVIALVIVGALLVGTLAGVVVTLTGA